MDEEQLQLGASKEFWKLITARRIESAISRTELELRLHNVDELEVRFNKGNVHNDT